MQQPPPSQPYPEFQIVCRNIYRLKFEQNECTLCVNQIAINHKHFICIYWHSQTQMMSHSKISVYRHFDVIAAANMERKGE